MSVNHQNKPIAVVTGSNGFVGSHLVELLLSKGYRVKCIIRKTSNLRWLKGLDVEFHDCGLSNVEDLRTVFQGATYIFHIAGVVTAKKPDLFYKGNVETTRHVLDAAVGISSIRKILITSSLAASTFATPGKPVTEDTPSAPVSTYGKSKVQQEQLSHTYMDKLPITIIRPPVVYGERDTEVLLLFKTIKRGLKGLVGFNDKFLSLVYVRDLVNGFVLAAESEKAIGQTYFLGSEQAEYSIEDVNNMVADLLDVKAIKVRIPHAMIYVVGAISQFFGKFGSKPPTLHIEKAREMTRVSWSCSSEKAMRELGYREGQTLREGLKRTLDWYKTEGWL